MKTKKPIQLTPIEFPVLGDSFIHYFVEPDRQRACDFVRTKRRGHGIEQFGGQGITFCKDMQDPIVWLQNRKPHVVAHEMIHAVRHMFSALGHDAITDDNDELFAYHVDYAISQILK